MWNIRLFVEFASVVMPGAVLLLMLSLLFEPQDWLYGAIYPPKATEDERLVQRQAFAGMLWSKQIYLFDITKWLGGDNTRCHPPTSRYEIRNLHWQHLNSMRALSMPDKWNYPDGKFDKFRVRSLVGMTPVYSVEELQLRAIQDLDEFRTNFLWFVNNRSTLTNAGCHAMESNGQQTLCAHRGGPESAASHALTGIGSCRVPLQPRDPEPV